MTDEEEHADLVPDGIPLHDRATVTHAVRHLEHLLPVHLPQCDLLGGSERILVGEHLARRRKHRVDQLDKSLPALDRVVLELLDTCLTKCC